MSLVRIVLPDNSVKEFDHEPTVLEVAGSIGPRLAKDTVGGILNGGKDVVDLRTVLRSGTRLKIVTLGSPESLEVIRHSAAHVMAQAVQELWPEIRVTIGPVIEDGFFYDFDSERPFSPEDLLKVEDRMKEIIARDESVKKEVWKKEKAIEAFSKMGETFKVEIIRDLGELEVSIYHQGEWFDLCRGPHVQKLGQIRAVKVLHSAGAYWRGNEKNKQLQRIYATAFNSEKELTEHLKLLEEAKLRDHRKLGRELGLVYFHELSPGAPFFPPKGAVLYNELVGFIREKYQKYGYQEVITPQIFDVELFHRSGHYENYAENMYFSKIDERTFSVKPMNCPGHCLLYGSELHSYRDLPWRVADFGRLHRYEKSGAVHGLNRVRSFSQDDAHVFCRMDQLQSEIAGFMTFLKDVYKTLGMTNFKVFLSTRPEKRMGSDEVWDQSEAALADALKSLGFEFELNPGDGAFYGPKIDITFVDALKRPWQLGTIQCDFNMPMAFHLKYIGEDNKDHTPVMLHRAILGSFERFIGVYTEHVAGKFPTWLAPVQVRLMTVTDKQADYGREVRDQLRALKVRVELDDRGEKLGFKIREAQLQKIPYMITLGDKEKAAGLLSLRLRNGETRNDIPRDKFYQELRLEIEERRLESSYLQQP